MLADLPYVLQGITTVTFPWHLSARHLEQPTSLGIPDTLVWPKIGLVNQLLEPAVLYKDIKTKIEAREATGRKTGGRPVGLVEQALFSAIEQELESYLTLAGVVESEIRKEQLSSSRIPKRITLRKSTALLQEATMGLRLIHSILSESRDLVGGQILSLIHEYTLNGDQTVSKFASRLLPLISIPFFDMLDQWINGGQLFDPHDEFFVKQGNEDSMWDSRFILSKEKVPSYMKKEVSEKVFQIGKTLYFVRVTCDDRDWVEERQAAASALRHNVDSSDNLEQHVNDAYVEVLQHLNDILRSRFSLDAHLKGLKDYLLLGKGDFVQLLVENAAPMLDKPALQLFRHHLTATLETAIRGSDAENDEDEVLKSLDARMLELGHGDIGWDVFTLDYRVEQPLDTVILDRSSMTQYHQVFNFLWRIKRVSFELNNTWKRIATSDRAGLLSVKLPNEMDIIDDAHWSKLTEISEFVKEQWKIVRAVCQEMLHFVGELQYYINYEVVEMAWAKLQLELNGDKDADQTPVLSVDEIIKAHKSYLKQITYKGLLGGEDVLMGELHSILKIILEFKTSVDGLHDVTSRLDLGEGSEYDEKRTVNIGILIADLRKKFESNIQQLVEQLRKLDDGEMRFLGVRLDFNGFYSKLSSP